jgi:hypothetical protein
MKRRGSVYGFIVRLLAVALGELGILGVIVLCDSADPLRALGGALVASAGAGLCLVTVYVTMRPKPLLARWSANPLSRQRAR